MSTLAKTIIRDLLYSIRKQGKKKTEPILRKHPLHVLAALCPVFCCTDNFPYLTPQDLFSSPSIILVKLQYRTHRYTVTEAIEDKCREVAWLLFSLQAMPQAEELPAVVVAKLSTDGFKDIGSSVISPVYFCFHSSEFNLSHDTMFAAVLVLRLMNKLTISRHVSAKHCDYWLPTPTSALWVSTIY